MANITADMIKELRERSGVGMSKCKEALVEAQGDMTKAIEILRKSGLASSVKKEGREAKEGVINAFQTKDHIALVEVNTETDFVAKNERFVQFVDVLAEQAAEEKPQSLDLFIKSKYKKDKAVSIDDQRNLMIQALGENIQITRLEIIHKAKDASYGIYSHMGGKIVTIVEIKGSADVEDLARDIAMHVAADDPEYLKPEEVPENIKKKEEEIARSQIKGKPENVIEKIIAGKIKAYYDQVCLICQKYIKDTSVTVQQFVENKGKEAGKKMEVTCFWRWKLGEKK